MAGAMTKLAAKQKATDNALDKDEVWFVITFLDGFTVTNLDGLKVRAEFGGGCKIVAVMDPEEIRSIAEAEADAWVNEP